MPPRRHRRAAPAFCSAALAGGLLAGGVGIEAAPAAEALADAARTAPRAADTAAVRFAAAQSLIASGRYARAARLLGRLARERPDLDRVQLDYAAVLFVLGRDGEAEEIFRAVRRREGLPEPVRRNVEAFLERIRARKSMRIDLDLGLWRDGNVNGASEYETVEIPIFGGLPFTLDQRPVRAWVARTGVRLRWRGPRPAADGAYVETRAAAARNTALGRSGHNRTWANAAAGPRIPYRIRIAGRPRSGIARADLGVERRWRGGDGYARGVWTGFGLDQTLSPVWRAGLSPRFWKTRYDEGGDETRAPGRSLGLYLSRRVGPGWLTVRARASREKPARRTLRWSSREAWGGYAADPGRGWTALIEAGAARTRFDGEHPLFRSRREDRSRSLALTVSHRKLEWEGRSPELTLTWSRTASNVPLYDRTLRTVRIGLRRRF